VAVTLAGVLADESLRRIRPAVHVAAWEGDTDPVAPAQREQAM
jgi:hypothetical protein